MRNVMIGNRSRDTQPEVAIRRQLHAAGYRYRVDLQPVRNIRRSADIVFTRVKLAVFIDGCFWHGCDVHYVPSKTNVEYWSNKIESNKSRDRDTDQKLIASGWVVYRVWAHTDPRAAAKEIAAVVERLRERS